MIKKTVYPPDTMKNIPQSVKNELKSLQAMDEPPYKFLLHKIMFCVKLYSADYKKLGKMEIFNIMKRFPELIDYRFLTDIQIDFVRQQYTFGLESI